MLRVVSIGEILQDTSGLEDSDLLAVSKGICDGWYAAVGVYLEEPRLLLGVLSEFDSHDFIREATFQCVSDFSTCHALAGSREEAYPSSSKAIEILMPLGVCEV